jgi:hypothetical protein
VSVRPGSSRGRAASVAALLATWLNASIALAERNPQNGAPDPPSHRRQETPSPITDRFYVAGIFYTYSLHTTLRLNPSGAVAAANPTLTGTSLNGERDLGLLSRQYQGRMEAMLRVHEHNKLRLDFEQVNRSASQVQSRDIQFGNVSAPTGSQLDSQVNWRMATLTYTYSVYRRDWLEVGVGAALQMVETRVQADVRALREYQADSLAAFFPTGALDVTWRFARRFALTARAQYMSANIGAFSGSLLIAHGDVQYRWNPSFAVGVGYTAEYIDTQLSSAQDELTLHMRGPEAFFHVSF